MSTVHVIGAGIAGPMAALVQARNGNTVTVFERRAEPELRSDSILGITDHNWERLAQLSVDLTPQELPNDYTDLVSSVTVTSQFHYITWTDLHLRLTWAAIDAGVLFYWGTDYMQRSDHTVAPDLVINASGVGSAADVSSYEYSGYVIYRGFSPVKSGTNWSIGSYEGELGRFVIAVGDTREGASITMFVPRDQAEFRTNYTAVAPDEANDLPTSLWSLTTNVALWQYTPMSDWTVPDKMVQRSLFHRGTELVRIGDANGQVRPSTSMGANLAIEEAYNLDMILSDRYAEGMALTHREAWKEYGEQLGVLPMNELPPITVNLSIEELHLWICGVCASLVLKTSWEKHAQWHAQKSLSHSVV